MNLYRLVFIYYIDKTYLRIEPIFVTPDVDLTIMFY